MKKITAISLFIAISMLTSTTGNAKNQKGVYLTAADYAKKRLSYEHNSKIQLNNSVIELPYIIVKDSSKTIRLKKAEIFAYVSSDNSVYRFYKNSQYLISEESPITIYIQYEHVAQSKGYKTKQSFFFSTTPEGQLIPLTLNNIKQAYITNTRFIELLDEYFRNGDITAYDAFHKMYRVNYVFSRV